RAAQIDANLLEIDRDRLFAVPVFGAFLMMMVRTGPRGHAIAAVVEADRGAEAGSIAEPSQAGTERAGFGRAIWQPIRPIGGFEQLLCLAWLFLRLGQKRLPERSGDDESPDFDVVGRPIAAVDMRHELSGKRDVERGAALAQVVGRVDRCQGVEMERLVWRVARDALIDYVDCTADRRTAIKQDRRTAQHFD